MVIDECYYRSGQVESGGGGMECRLQYKRDDSDQGVLLAIVELPPQAEE